MTYWREIEVEYLTVELLDLPPSRLMSLLKIWVMKNLENEEARRAFEAELLTPLPWQSGVTQKAIEEQTDMFMALFNEQQEAGK